MGLKVSELNTLTNQEYNTKLEEGLIPVVIEDNLGNKVNKKFTLLDYWTKVLLSKVAEECERHKSIYNFGGEINTSGGGSESGSGSGSSSEETGVDPAAWQTVQDRVDSMWATVSNLSNSYYALASGNQLSNDFATFRDSTYATYTANTDASLSGMGQDIQALRSALNRTLYIKVLDPSNRLAAGYKYSPATGVSTVASTEDFPAQGVIELRTESYATALYHLQLNTGVSASYDTLNRRYIIALGTLTISKPEGVTTNYIGGEITAANRYVSIVPSWDNTTMQQYTIPFDSNGSFPQELTSTYYFYSENDNLINSEYLIVVIKVGNWSQTFTITRGIHISGDISKDIIAAA